MVVSLFLRRPNLIQLSTRYIMQLAQGNPRAVIDSGLQTEPERQTNIFANVMYLSLHYPILPTVCFHSFKSLLHNLEFNVKGPVLIQEA
jgi:hypothetical protein